VSGFHTREEIAAALRDMLAKQPEVPRGDLTREVLIEYRKEVDWFAGDLAWLARSIVRAVDGESAEVKR